MSRMSVIVSLCVSMFVVGVAGQAHAQQIECRSTASTVKAVTSPDYHPVTTKFQFDTPNLQPLPQFSSPALVPAASSRTSAP